MAYSFTVEVRGRTYEARPVNSMGVHPYDVYDLSAAPPTFVGRAYMWRQVTPSGMGTTSVWAWQPKAESGRLHPSLRGLLQAGLPTEAAA